MYLTSYWLYLAVPWSFLIELAPGVQQVTQDGDPIPLAPIECTDRISHRTGKGTVSLLRIFDSRADEFCDLRLRIQLQRDCSGLQLDFLS